MNEYSFVKEKMQPDTADADVQLKNNYSARTNEQHFIYIRASIGH